MTAHTPEDDTSRRRALALLIVCVIVGRLGLDHMRRQVPFIAVLDQLGDASTWERAVDVIFVCGATLVFTRLWRLGALLAGGAELLRVLGDMPSFSNGRTFDALLLLLAGLASEHTGNRPLRLQYLLLYIGAALNKVIDPDWWNGTFVQATVIDNAIGHWIARSTLAAQLASWATMASEGAIAVLLLFRRTRVAGIALCLAFHVVLLVVLREDFGTFFYTVAIGSILLFAPDPPQNIQQYVVVPRRWWLVVSAVVVLIITRLSAMGHHTIREVLIISGTAAVGVLALRLVRGVRPV